MKELYNILAKDIASDNFTKRELIIYGVLAPLALVAFCMLADFINQL